MANPISPRRLDSRKYSVMATPGREGQQIQAGVYAGRAIGVFTSGGDSQGYSFFISKHNINTYSESMGWHDNIILGLT